MSSHSLPQGVLLSPDPVLPSTSEHQRRRSSSASTHNMEELSPVRTVTIEQHCVGMAESTMATSRAHPLHRRRSAPTPDSMGVAKSKLDSVPIPGPCANRFLPPAPVRISTNNLPGPPSGGKRRGLSSHDHHQEATGELKSHIGGGKNHKEVPLDTATSSRSSSPPPSIPPLMDLNFKRQNPREQSPLASSVDVGMPIAPDSRSNSISPIDDAFVVDLETSISQSSDIVSLPLSNVPRDGAFPPPLSQSEKNALPFSSFFETDGPQSTVGVSDSYLSSGQKASPCTKKIAIRSSESSDTLRPDINTDSDNEGDLVIDESFVSQNGGEASPDKDKSSREHEKSSNRGGSLSSSITIFSDIEPPSSPDCEILSISTVDSIPSSSRHHKAVSSSDAEHRATPESTASSELSKSSVLASISARHRSIMPASQRARKLASSVVGAKLVEKLVEGDEMEQDLLRRFFKAVVMVTERLKWKYRSNSATPTFLSYYKKVFHGFVTGTLNKRENVPSDLYKQELKALQAKCGPYISKWKEQLQRYILRAGTLPKDKTDLEPFMKNRKVLMKHVTASNVVMLSGTSDSDSDRPIDSHKAKPHPPAPPTATVQHKARPSSDSDRPTDPRKANPLPLSLSTLSAKALQPSAFTPVTSTSSPSTSLASPSSKSTDSTTVLTTSPKKPVTLLQGQSIQTDELNTESYMFKPVSTLSESDQRDDSLFTVDRSADYSLDPELDRAPSGFSSHSSSSLPSSEPMVVIDLVGENLQGSYTYLPQMTGSLADEEQSLTGEKVTMNVVLSSFKERSEATPTVADQSGPSKANMTSEKASPDRINLADSGIKDDLGSNKSSNKLDTANEAKANNVAASESCDSSTEAEDGEIISSSPSPAPSPPPEKQSIPPVLPMIYGDPDRWSRVNSRERGISRQRHWHSLHRSSRSRSPSPGAQRRGSSPERFYRKRPSRCRLRSRSWSRDRLSRSHDRRRRSISRDRRSRSRDRRSRDRRYHHSRTRSRSRGKSRSPMRRLRSQKSNAAEKSQRRASRSDREKDGKGSIDSEDELEILKREALASMKQTTSGSAVKSSAQEEHSRDGVENDDHSERGEADMDLCSQSSEEGEEEGKGEADMELCSESAGEGGAEGVSGDRDRRETGKMEKGYASSQGSVLGDKEGSSVVGGSGTVEVTFGEVVYAASILSEAGWNQQSNKLELTKEDLIVDYDVAARQDESSPSDTPSSQAEKKKSEDQSSTGQGMEQSTACSPAQVAPVGRSASAPSEALGDKSPKHIVDSLPTMKQSLPAATTGQQSLTSAESSTQSPLATASSQSSAVRTAQPSATKVSQPSATKNGQPSVIAEKPLSAVATRSKSSDITAAKPSTVGITQPSLSKASTGKISQPPTATKASTASPVAANSQQTVAATKARQPSTAKATQVKVSQATSVKATQPSVKTSQALSVKTAQPSVKTTPSQSAKGTQASSVKSIQTAQAKLSSGQKTGQAAVIKTSQASALKATQTSSSQASVAKTSQPSVSTSVATAGSKVADLAAIKSLKKSLSRSSSRSGSKANSPCLSPTHASSPSGSNDSLGVGGAVGGASSNDVRVRHRSGSCVKVCILYTNIEHVHVCVLFYYTYMCIEPLCILYMYCVCVCVCLGVA